MLQWAARWLFGSWKYAPFSSDFGWLDVAVAILLGSQAFNCLLIALEIAGVRKYAKRINTGYLKQKGLYIKIEPAMENKYLI